MRSPITIRAAEPSDAAAVLALHVRARTTYYRGFMPDEQLAAENRRRTEDYEAMIRSADRVVRCAELDGHLAGFLLIAPPYYDDPDPGVGSELYQIHVDPGHFRQGVGTRLHDTAVEIWRGMGIVAARLWAWEFNERARAFYLHHGWRHDGYERPDEPRLGRYRMVGYRLGLAN